MELTLGVTFAVLGAALLHATWNALIKSGRDPLLDMALLTLAGSLLGTAIAALGAVPPPPPAAWPYIAASTVIHIGYYATVAAAYRAGDLSHGYPIMRGTAPLLTALGTWLFLGESLSPARRDARRAARLRRRALPRRSERCGGPRREPPGDRLGLDQRGSHRALHARRRRRRARLGR